MANGMSYDARRRRSYLANEIAYRVPTEWSWSIGVFVSAIGASDHAIPDADDDDADDEETARLRHESHDAIIIRGLRAHSSQLPYSVRNCESNASRDALHMLRLHIALIYAICGYACGEMHSMPFKDAAYADVAR